MERAGETVHRLSVDCQDAVTRAEAGLVCGAAGLDDADDGGLVILVHGLAGGPDDARHHKGEEKGKERAGKGDDDLVQRGDGRQGRFAFLGVAFDRLHGGELREFDKAAGGNAAEGIPDAAKLFAPDRLAKPDAEFIHDQPAPARGEKVAQFVDHNQEVKNEKDLQDDEDGVEQFGEHGGR